MPKFSTETPHALGLPEATERLKGLLEKIRQRYQDQVSDMEESWQDDKLTFSFKTYGFKIQGILTVLADSVKLDGELPFAAMMFKGKIEQSIHGELEKVLA